MKSTRTLPFLYNADKHSSYINLVAPYRAIPRDHLSDTSNAHLLNWAKRLEWYPRLLLRTTTIRFKMVTDRLKVCRN